MKKDQRKKTYERENNDKKSGDSHARARPIPSPPPDAASPVLLPGSRRRPPPISSCDPGVAPPHLLPHFRRYLSIPSTTQSRRPLVRSRSRIRQRRFGQTRPSWITRILMMGAWRWPWICYGDDGAGSAPATSGWRPATNPSLAVSIGIQPLLSVLGQGVWGCLLRRWTSTRRHLQHLPPVGLQDLYAQGLLLRA
ncbi:uncharacterized protein [Triticum aestivum]|uniref:uncharacterized protein n=1 Tax=Triticum aestivum TaxID=4565 RepID=UPI001D0322B2|nr:uncharacterized protein LOC123039634 [Triticum aestivum]